MSFLKADKIDKLTQDELIEALVYSNSSLDPTADAVKNLRAYYSMLPLEELRVRAKQGQLLHESKPVVVTSRVQYERDEEYKRAKAQKLVIHSIKLPKKIVTYTPLERVIADLAILKWVDDVTEICPDVIGLRCNIDKGEAKRIAMKIAEKHGYAGEFIYG